MSFFAGVLTTLIVEILIVYLTLKYFNNEENKKKWIS